MNLSRILIDLILVYTIFYYEYAALLLLLLHCRLRVPQSVSS
jgi:hypothetical protein